MRKRINRIVLVFFSLCFVKILFAAPVFTLTPLTSTSFQITVRESVTVKYLVQNQSRKTHTLVLSPIAGVTQNTTTGNCSSHFTLKYKEYCILTLQISGATMQRSIFGGPAVCQQLPNGSPGALCYQPSSANVLNISLIPINSYILQATTGGHGTISPSGRVSVERGNSVTFTARPDSGYIVLKWLVDGKVVQQGGTTYTLVSVKANHTIKVIFVRAALYVCGENGKIYFSINGGYTWNATTMNPAASPVNGIYATAEIIYAAVDNGFVYYSINNGATWIATTSPDGSAVNTVFLMGSVLYAGTDNGFVYFSTDNGTNWTATTAPDGSAVNSIFVTSDGLYAGTNNGSVFLSTNGGTTWLAINGEPDGSAIRGIFISNNTLYVNTSDGFVYSSVSLIGGGSWTWIAQTVYSLFVSPNDDRLYAATKNGFVYYVSEGDELGFVDYTQLNALFVI
ncbi:NHL repeat protein (plasmid) [Legionella adelaidensis]|uniref:NHL repeat protein n=1 Tax=Legionella adelaidensis TaxID=45056 RepID=A0A0W0R139_9GAMM|nr:hypothetical protein [Legionella adelaidensis]KTC64816.1 NHL repeat protein [Legionella adelaidensis]VEH86194.1 NHL repeat protein [Legionella adelaidensis]